MCLITRMAAAGAFVLSDPAGNRKLHKSKSYAKIDGSMARKNGKSALIAAILLAHDREMEDVKRRCGP